MLVKLSASYSLVNTLRTKNTNDFNVNEFTKDMDNVNKLSQATSKMFGSENENVFPDIKDVLSL